LLAAACAGLNRKENPMRVFFSKLIQDEAGVTAIEYGLIAALIAVAAVTIMGTVGTNLSQTFSRVAASL
jgi:pilus assembly protein Flp/PilA